MRNASMFLRGNSSSGRVGLVLVFLLTIMISAQAQVTTGNIRGLVKDPNGALVTGATVTVTDKRNGHSQTTQTSSDGEFEFSNLLPGDYNMNIEAANFKSLRINEVKVDLNKTTDIPVELAVGVKEESITISAAGSELVQTTTTTLSRDFSERQAVDLAQTSTGVATGINNLALLAANV